jgi:hypothetical protein
MTHAVPEPSISGNGCPQIPAEISVILTMVTGGWGSDGLGMSIASADKDDSVA